MTYRQVAVQGGLALVALVAAYFTWQREAELAPGEVVVVDINKGELTAVRFEDQEKSTWVELGRADDDGEPLISVHLSPQDEPKKPAGAKEPTVAVNKTPDRIVRGSDAAEKLFASFAPLRASRGLGILAADKLKDLGLSGSQKRITLTLRNGKRTFAIAPAPPGGAEPYLRDELDGRVYVVARSMLSDFGSAASILVERHAHTFRLEDADRMVVTYGKTRREFLISKGENGVRLAPPSAPDKPDASLKTWHDRVFSVWPIEVLGKDEVPAEGSPQLELHVDYSARGRRLGFAEIAMGVTVASPAESTTDAQDAKDAKKTLYARSERSLGWFKLSSDARTILSDAERILH
jgi:hypothetical protein